MRYWMHPPHHPNIVFRASSVEAVQSMVATGAGVAILPDIEARTIEDDLPWDLDSKLNPCTRACRDFCYNTCNASGGQAS